MAAAPARPRRPARLRAGAHRDGTPADPQLVERLLAVENEALADLPRTVADRLIGDLGRVLSTLDHAPS